MLVCCQEMQMSRHGVLGRGVLTPQTINAGLEAIPDHTLVRRGSTTARAKPTRLVQ